MIFSYTVAVFFKFLLLGHIDTTVDIPPLWASDGGLYGCYAKEILLGKSFTFDSEHIPAYLLTFVVKLFSISLDKAIFFSPAFLSSLSIVPIIMIGYIYKIVKFSFFVSIIGSLTYSYYIRSFLGYYDTDSLNIFFSLTIVAFLIAYIEKKKIKYLFISIVFMLLFLLWYHSAELIVFAIVANFILYILIWKYKQILKRKNLFLLALFFLVMLTVFYHKEIYLLFVRAYDYIFKVQNIYLVQDDNHKLIFKSTLSTVSEAKALPIYKLGKYLSINNFYLYLSLLSLCLFCFRFKSFFLTLSLLLISLLSIKSGIRFSEYGAYIVAFGAVYILYIVKNILVALKFNRYVAQVIFISLSVFVLSFYLRKVIEKNRFLHPVFSAQSVGMLHSLDRRLKKDDYILTWWDYGWPLWYYTKANTLIDNGKHFEDNYIISKLLFSNQRYTAKAARYFMEKCSGRRCYLSRIIYENHSPSEIDRLIREYKPKKKTKDIYFLFHSRMVRIMKVILDFSRINPQTGVKTRDKIVKVIKIGSYKNRIFLSRKHKIKLDLNKKVLIIKHKKFALKDIYIVGSKVQKIKTRYKKAKIYAIIYKNSYIVLCNKKVFNSFIIQAMVLSNYDRRYFSLVEKGDEIKILKLKN